MVPHVVVVVVLCCDLQVCLSPQGRLLVVVRVVAVAHEVAARAVKVQRTRK